MKISHLITIDLFTLRVTTLLTRAIRKYDVHFVVYTRAMERTGETMEVWKLRWPERETLSSLYCNTKDTPWTMLLDDCDLRFSLLSSRCYLHCFPDESFLRVCTVTLIPRRCNVLRCTSKSDTSARSGFSAVKGSLSLVFACCRTARRAARCRLRPLSEA